MQITPVEAVKRVLAHIERQAKNAVPVDYNTLLAFPDVPADILREHFGVFSLGADGNPDRLPSLLIEAPDGQAQLELCPFGPLVLITPDGGMDVDVLAQTLLDAGLFPLFPADVDGFGAWHDVPLARWLFPARLSAALSLFDSLHQRL